MLDAFEILTTSGIVLWRKHYAPVSPSIINSLVGDIFIEDRRPKATAGSTDAPPASSYKKDRYTLKWTGAKDLGVVFVVGEACPGRIQHLIEIGLANWLGVAI